MVFGNALLFGLEAAQLLGITLRNKLFLSGFLSSLFCKLVFFNLGKSNGRSSSCTLSDLSALVSLSWESFTREGLYAPKSLPISKSNEITRAQLSICLFLSFGMSNGTAASLDSVHVLQLFCLLLNFGMSKGSSGGSSTALCDDNVVVVGFSA